MDDQNLREFATAAIQHNLPGRKLKGVRDLGGSYQRILEAELESGERLIIKIDIQNDPLERSWHEQQVVEILQRNNLPAPDVLAVDTSERLIPNPYIIQRKVGGTKLFQLLEQVPEEEQVAIFHAVGRYYSRMHAITNDRSGVWTETPEKPWGSPVDFYYANELVKGSGRATLDAGILPPKVYERVLEVWAEQLEELKEHQPSLVHNSAFPWTIYLEDSPSGWTVTKLTSLGDVLWWDPAFDLALIRYPPFLWSEKRWWKAFLDGYGEEPDRKRVDLYTILQRLMAVMGAYREPQELYSEEWAKEAVAEIPMLLDEIENR